MQTIIIDLTISAKEIDSIKQALKASNHDNDLLFRTRDGNFFKVTGILKKAPKPR